MCRYDIFVIKSYCCSLLLLVFWYCLFHLSWTCRGFVVTKDAALFCSFYSAFPPTLLSLPLTGNTRHQTETVCRMVSICSWLLFLAIWPTLHGSHIIEPSCCIHYHLPPKRDTELTSWLRLCIIFPVIQNKTRKYCSLIYFNLPNFQYFYFVFYLHLYIVLFVYIVQGGPKNRSVFRSL